MGDISKERREQLRARSALYHADILIFSFDIDMTHAELRALLDAAAERDAALAEVQRLREAAVQGEWYRDDETGHIYMANFRVLSKEEGRRKLAARGVTFGSDDSLLTASPDQVARSLVEPAP